MSNAPQLLDRGATHAPRLSTHWVEMAISHTLRAGVMVAAAIILGGVLLFVTGHHDQEAPRSFDALIHSHASAIDIAGIVRGAARLDSTSVIELGVLVLILTPVVRVAMTVGVFAVEGDPTFLVIVCVVLAVLILGLTGVVG
jgi:uncharacterized membrane protein